MYGSITDKRYRCVQIENKMGVFQRVTLTSQTRHRL